MILIRRWALAIVLAILTVNTLQIHSIEYLITCVLIGFGVGNLFKKDEK